MLILFGIVICEIGILWIYTKKYSIGLFNILWGCILVSFGIGSNGSTLSGETLGILSLMIICVNIGFVAGGRVYTIKRYDPSGMNFDEDIYLFEFNDILFVILEFFSMAIVLYYFFKTIRNTGFNLRLVRLANNSSSEESVFSSWADTIVFYGIAIPIIYNGIFTIIYNLLEKISFKKWSIGIVAANVILVMLVSGGRSILMRAILFVGSALIWQLHSEESMDWSAKWKILVGGILAFILLNVVTYSRNTVKIGIVAQTIDYLQGSIVHLNYQLENLAYSGPHFGSIVYGGFFYYIIKIINLLLGTSLQTSNDVMAYLQNYVYLVVNGKTVYYNALVPNVFYYYFDSGIVGVIVFSFILGFSGRNGECNQDFPTFFSFVIWACSFYAFMYSPFGGIFWNFSVATAVIYSWILRNLLFKRKIYVLS